MELIQSLTSLGLHQKQAAVYLALLELGSATVLELARKAKIKRSTVYVVLDELENLKLVKAINKKTTTLFLPESPENIGTELEAKLGSYNTIKPFLSDLFLQEHAKPLIRYYSGKDEVEALYANIISTNAQVDFFGTDAAAFIHHFPKFTELALEYLQTGKCTTREIVALTKQNIHYAKQHEGRFQKIRFIDPKYPFYGDNAIYGNTLLILSLADMMAVTIESKDVVRTFSSLFEMMWNFAIPQRKIPKSALKNVPRGTI